MASNKDLRVLDLWKTGLSALQISERMQAVGVTLSRSAVTGILHRLRQDGFDTSRAGPVTRAARRAPIPPKIEEDQETGDCVIVPPAPLAPRMPTGQYTLAELAPKSCHWPTGERGNRFLFCGAAADAYPYCEEHRQRAFTPAEKVRRPRK